MRMKKAVPRDLTTTMMVGAAEATGLDFVCFVIINPRVSSANKVDFGLLIFPPPPPGRNVLFYDIDLPPAPPNFPLLLYPQK